MGFFISQDIDRSALPAVEGENVAATGAKSNLEPYKKLLDGFIAGQVSEPQFQWTYLEMFRADASLRSQEEFDVLNSLFGNPEYTAACTVVTLGLFQYFLVTAMRHHTTFYVRHKSSP